MDWNNTGPVGEIDGDRAYRDFFDGPAREREHVAHGLLTVVESALTLSVEAVWPTLLKLSRRAESGDIRLSSDWKIASAKTASGFDSTFVMEHDDHPGGFLFNLGLRGDMTEEAKARIKAVGATALATAEAIEDPDIRAAAVTGLVIPSLPEVVAISSDLSSYVVTDQVNRVSCCVYRADGLYPPGYDGTAPDLETTLATGFFEAYQHGLLFECAPSVHLQIGIESFRDSIPVSSSHRLRDVSMSLVAMEVLAGAFSELGLLDEVDARMKSLSDIGYEHYVGDQSETLLIQMGMGSVLTTGFPWEKTLGLAHHFWTAAAALDIGKTAKLLEATVAKMRADGNVSEDAAVEWSDGSCRAFVNPADEDGDCVLMVSTGAVTYRLDFDLPGDGAIPGAIAACVVRGAAAWPVERPDPERRGFLFGFTADGEDPGYWPTDIGEMTTANIRSLNGIVMAVEALASEVAPAAANGRHPPRP